MCFYDNLTSSVNSGIAFFKIISKFAPIMKNLHIEELFHIVDEQGNTVGEAPHEKELVNSFSTTMDEPPVINNDEIEVLLLRTRTNNPVKVPFSI